MSEKAQKPDIINTVMTAPAGGLGAALPEGVVRHDNPRTEHDYVIADPTDQRAIDDILYKVVCETRQSMEPSAQLYIVIGEEHTMPIHRLTQAGLLDNLAATKQSLLYAYELPYDMSFSNIIYNDKKVKNLHEHDPLGHRFIRITLGLGYSPHSPQSIRRIFNRCLKNNIPLASVDASKDEGEIDFSDALARIWAKALYKDFDPAIDKMPTISFTNTQRDFRGIILRNAVMAQRTIEAAARHQADTVIVGTGMRHLDDHLTDESLIIKRDTSLLGFLRQMIGPQDKVLPVFFSPERYSVTCTNPDAVIFHGDHHARYEGKGVLDRLLDKIGMGAENRFIRKLGNSYKRAARPVPARFAAPKEPNPKAVREELRVWIKEAIQAEGISGPEAGPL